jgi:hypothetical protein
MLSLSILSHEYPNAFKGKNHSLINSPNPNAAKELWNFVCDFVGKDSNVIFLEFGVWRGNSMKYFSDNFVNKNNIFIGLDTFEGLPEDWETANFMSRNSRKQLKGSYTAAGEIPDFKDERVFFIKGLFQDTSEKWLKEVLTHDKKILVCHFDADIYSSTLYGLTRIGSLKKSFFCLFDEFIGDECRALEDFKESYLFKSKLIASSVHGSNSLGRSTPQRICFFKISPI